MTSKNKIIISRPKQLSDILILQYYLDNSINSIRERTDYDIKLSMIAEIIEFNEETLYSHKTWKTKEYKSDNEKEEFVDILFFYAQLTNYWLEKFNNDISSELLNRLDDVFNAFHFKELEKNAAALLQLIKLVEHGNLQALLERLISIAHNHKYSKQDLLDTYWEKWKTNMKRIGKEWN